MDKRVDFDFGSNTREHRLAELLRERTDMKQEKKDYNQHWKERAEILDHEISRLRDAILTGQSDLFEPKPNQEEEIQRKQI